MAETAGRVSGRPPTPRGAATRERIVAAAARIVHAKGADRTSLDDVMASAEVSRSQLYHYFANKDALIGAVIDWQAARILAGTAAAMKRFGRPGALSRWRASLVEANRVGMAEGCPLGSLANELSAQSTAARERLNRSFGAWRDVIADGLERMRKAGQLRTEADAAALATAMLAAIQGGILLAKTAHEIRPLELALDMALAHVEQQAAGHED